MNMQTIDGVKDTQVQASESSSASVRRDAAHAVEKVGSVQSKSDQSDGENREKKSESADVAAIAKQADQYFQAKGVNLHFKVLDDNAAVQVEMVDAGTEKVICKIPSDDIIKLQESMKRMAKGVKDVSV